MEENEYRQEEEQQQTTQSAPVYTRLEQYSNPYIMNQGQNSAYGNAKPVKVKKKHPVLKKLTLSIVTGILFGIFAGLGVYVVYGLSGAGFGMAKIERMRSEVDDMASQLEDMQAAMSSSVQSGSSTASGDENTGVEPKSRDIEIDGTNEDTQIPQMDTQTVTAVVTDVTEVVKTAMPCVVSITNLYTDTDWYGESTQEEASGSGIIVGETDDELLIVTNYHVIEGCDELSVQFIDDSEVLAYVKGTDSDNDLAVITVFMFGLIVVASEDLGVALQYLFIFVIMAFVGGVSLLWFLGAGAVLLVASPFLWQFLSYDRRSRIWVLFDPRIDAAAQDQRYQMNRSLRALQNGGVTGQGLYHGSMVQSGSIPAQHTDLIFSSIGEELGMLGCMAVLILLTAIIIRIIHVGIKSGNYMNRLICVGIAGMLTAQVFINIGVCIGLVPVIGLTLPFFSYGGTSVLTMYAALGIAAGVRMREKPSWLQH